MYIKPGGGALCILCIVLLVNPLIGSASRKCQQGVNRYDSVNRKCRKCKCRKGFGLDRAKMVRYDEEFGALQCPPCQKCQNGFYSNRFTGFTCIICSTHCETLNRTTLKSCNGRRNNVCGTCITGYYSKYPRLTSYPCKMCTSQSKDMGECQVEHVSISSATLTSSTDMEFSWAVTKPTNMPTKQARVNKGDPTFWTTADTIAITCICFFVVGGLAIILVICLLRGLECSKRTDNPSRENYGSGTTCISLLTPLGDEPSRIELEVDGCEEDRLTSGKREKMEGTQLFRSNKIIRDIAAQIDRNPEPLFKELNIAPKVMYQEKHHKENNDHCEYVYRVLNRWTEISGREVRLSVLYDALENCGFREQCSKIRANLR